MIDWKQLGKVLKVMFKIALYIIIFVGIIFWIKGNPIRGLSLIIAMIIIGFGIYLYKIL